MPTRCLLHLLISCTLTALCAPGTGSAPVEEPPVGWFNLYTVFDVSMDKVPESGATMLATLGGWRTAPEEGKYDFWMIDRQIEYAERNNLKLSLIAELNPLYTPEWLKKKVREAGEGVQNSGGQPGDIPSIESKVFRSEQDELIRRTLEFIRQRDTKHVVRWFHPGAEWWFPSGYRYARADVARFREWLKARYRSVAALNASWASNYSSFDAVPAPKVDSISAGKTRFNSIMSPDAGAQECSWSTGSALDPNAQPGDATFPAVTPGKTYTLSMWVKANLRGGPGVFPEIAWIGPRGGPPVSGGVGPQVQRTNGWERLSLTLKAPTDAGRTPAREVFVGQHAEDQPRGLRQDVHRSTPSRHTRRQHAAAIPLAGGYADDGIRSRRGGKGTQRFYAGERLATKL